eukprot:86592-Amphidinium_carterae.1
MSQPQPILDMKLIAMRSSGERIGRTQQSSNIFVAEGTCIVAYGSQDAWLRTSAPNVAAQEVVDALPQLCPPRLRLGRAGSPKVPEKPKVLRRMGGEIFQGNAVFA